jgi:AmmeMemoRadiSam system protein B
MYKLKLTILLGVFILVCSEMPGQTKKVGPKTANKLVLVKDTSMRVRGLADTIGYAHLKDQLELIIQRIDEFQGPVLNSLRNQFDISQGDAWRLAIAPHDDYSYAGFMYPLVLKNVQAKTVIIFGVAHKAKQFNVDNQLVFDSYTHWRGPYGNIKVSAMREEILKELPKSMYQINDSLQAAEYSVEAELPYLQYFNRDVEIISILVPPMSLARMNDLADPLSRALAKVFKKKDVEWGVEVALLVSTDAVHYGDEDWGGKDFSFYGTDSIGYRQAVDTEQVIIQKCLAGDLQREKIKKFTQYTVQEKDYTAYKWTWCGSYSVPFGMLTALDLQIQQGAVPLSGMALDYCTSIDHPPVLVDDAGMGVTAKATLRHWVGYAAVVFR